MLTFKTIAALSLTSLAVVACGATPDASEATESSQAALGQPVTMCMTDANCGKGLVCDPICPSVPGRAHCEIAGGTCEPICNRPASSLAGTTFTSADGAHSVQFTSETKFVKTDGCPTTGVHCEHIQQSTGTYVSDGSKIWLDASVGSSDTLAVESHCYAGLYDNGNGVELYPGSN